jgi:hypothetical protein
MGFLAHIVGADSCVTFCTNIHKAMAITIFLHDYFDSYNIIHFTTRIILITYTFVEVVCSERLKCGNKRQHPEQPHPFSAGHGGSAVRQSAFQVIIRPLPARPDDRARCSVSGGRVPYDTYVVPTAYWPR